MKSTISVFFLIIYYGVNAQVATLRGIVSDSLGNPMVYATLIAKPMDKDESIQFTSTKANGSYVLGLYKNVQYTISVSMLGFKPSVFTYIPLKDTTKDIELTEDVTRLDEVTVEFELPIEIKKDTIIYKVDQFVTGEERKLKDVLKKLPGIEVDKDGTITSQGKKVTHLMVEDKSFFGGNSKLATDNIPADAIKKIEIIDDYNEISFLKGMTVTDNMALNVKLKEGKKNFVFGDTEAGKGNDNFYKAHANLFYYRPDLNVNFIGGSNNTGEQTFTLKDYQNFIGGPSTVFNARDVAEEETISDAVEISDVTESERKLGALNFTKTLSDNIDVSSYLIYSDLKYESRVETTNQYILPDGSFIENGINTGAIAKKIGLGKIKLKYMPNTMEQWSFDILAKGVDNTDQTAILSIIDTVEQTFESFNDSEAININGNLEWHKKLSDKHAVSSSANIVHEKNNANTLWDTNRAISDVLIPLETDDVYSLKLLRQVSKNTMSIVGKYYWNVDNFNLLHMIIGNQYKAHQFITNDSQILDDGTINNFTSSGFGNDLDFKWNNLYAGAYYNARAGEFEFHQSLFIHNFTWSLNQTNNIKKSKWVLLPDISIRRRSSTSGGFLRLDSRLRSSFSDVASLASNFYLQSYNSIYMGNENLENELRHYSSLTYSKSSLLRGLYTLGVVSYTYRINGITTSIVTDNQDRLLSPIRLTAPSQNLSGTLIVKKSAKNFKYGLTGRLNSSITSQQINDVISEYKNITGSYRVSIQTLHKNFPVIEVGFKQTLGNYGTDNNIFDFITNEPFFSFDYDFLKSFVFSFDYTYFDYQNKTADISNTFSMSNTALSYGKENSPWVFKLSIQNLFDVEFKNQNSFNVFVVSDQNTFILPRIMMFSFTYKL